MAVLTKKKAKHMPLQLAVRLVEGSVIMQGKQKKKFMPKFRNVIINKYSDWPAGKHASYSCELPDTVNQHL